MRFLLPGLPQPPDDLKGGVGLAGAGRHDEQDAVLALGDGFDGRVDGVDLVVARRLAAAVVVVVLQDDLLGFRRQAFPGAVARPEFGRRRERVEREFGFGRARSGRCGRGTRSRRRWRRRRTGMSSVSAYSSACCMPSPTLWLLSLASMSARGMFGL